ncbi:UNVERIFIED_CONTAM: hypothetical protein Slati_3502700 [Sesamum latifolium]|uniref:Uncharacterized protein n=1 Tax=Sesamum latifolium TaxID=2727402 RepID=A0AAW2UIV9_9LAMI
MNVYVSGPHGYGPSINRLPTLVYGMELGVGSHPGPGIYAYYLRPCCAELLDIGTSYPFGQRLWPQLFLAQHVSKCIGDTAVM